MPTILLTNKQRAILHQLASINSSPTQTAQLSATTIFTHYAHTTSGCTVYNSISTESIDNQDNPMAGNEFTHLPLRARIVLASAEGRLVKDIADSIGVSPSMVYIWRRRWRDMAPKVAAAEQKTNCEGDDCLLKRTIRAVLDRASTRNKSSKVSDEQLSQIVELARLSPQTLGLTAEFWTMKSLADAAIQYGIVEQMSPTRLSYLLRSINFEPST